MGKTHTFTNAIVLTGDLSVLFARVTAPGNWLVGPRHPQTYDVMPIMALWCNIWETPNVGDRFVEITKSGPFKQSWVWEVIALEHNKTIAFRGTAWGLSAVLMYEFTSYETRFMFRRAFEITPTNLATRLIFPLFQNDIRKSGNDYFAAIRRWWSANK